MASIAELWTREQNDNLTEVDPEAAEARQLLKDHAIFGPFIGAKDIDTKSTGSKDDGITRFEDESWSILYKLLHDALIKSPDIDEKVAVIGDNNDHEDDDTSDNDERHISSSSTACSVALTMWLAFGQPNLPPLSSDNRQSLSLVANCIDRALASRSENTNQHRKKLKSRAIQMALRLGQVGCWDVGSSILDQTIDEQVLREAKDNDSSSNSAVSAFEPTPVDIDCAISVTNFLIDRLYSQTYVRDSDDDTRALSRAAQLGRWAVRKASSRHAAFLEKQRNNPDRPSIARDNSGESTISNRIISSSNNIPPPPVTSIFSNDCIRYLNALLAQAKALALLAQHVALGASDVRRLEFFPKPRHPLTINPSTEREVTVATHIMASQFFSDSDAIFSIPPAVMREQEPYQNEKDGDVFLRLTCAFQASRGEHFYCAASANTRWSRPIFTPLDTDANDDPIAECIRRSIRFLKETFEMIMSKLYEATNLDEELLSLAMRTAKDLGKACDFAERTGNANITLTNAGMYLDFAYLCSCFLLGSKHPSTMNIKRLHRIATEDTQTIAGRHSRVMPWLTDNFGPRNRDMML